MLNDRVALELAQAFAGRALAAKDPVDLAFRLAYSRPPDPWEKDTVATFFHKQESLIAARLAKGEKPALPAAMPDGLDPAHAAEMPQPSVEPRPEQSLVGPAVVGAATSAFARLHQAVQDSVPPPAAPDPGPAMGGNGKTVEDLVKEMLRPMLKEWLDRNLPPMVERYVEREIVRLTRR